MLSEEILWKHHFKSKKKKKSESNFWKLFKLCSKYINFIALDKRSC